MTVNEHERYDRQLRIWGVEGQEKIDGAVVTIIGDGPIARDTAMSLTALGVGQIRMIGNSILDEQKFLDVTIKGNAITEYRRVLNMINPNVDIVTVQASLESRTMQYFLEGSNAIVEATNDPRSKALTIDFSSRKINVPVLSASSSPGYAKIVGYYGRNPLEALMPDFEGLAQDDLISLGIGGVITEEVKKIVLNQRGDDLKKPVYLNLCGERFTHKKPDKNAPRINKDLFRRKKAVVVGAGALGNIGAIQLAKIGFGRVDYVDYDKVESHNLTRQITFYDCVEQLKATALSLKHKSMNPSCDARGICEKFEVKNGVWSMDQFNPEGCDILFDLVDNMYTRAMLAAYSVLKGIPLVSAASSPNASEWLVYVPGRTPCLEHLFAGYYSQGLKEEMIRRRSCTQDPNPAVIMTNQVAGAFAVLESLTIFQPEEFGKPFSGSFKYDTTKESRLSTRSVRDICDCHATKNVPNMEITPEMMEEERKMQEEKDKEQEARGKEEEVGEKTRDGRLGNWDMRLGTRDLGLEKKDLGLETRDTNDGIKTTPQDEEMAGIAPRVDEHITPKRRFGAIDNLIAEMIYSENEYTKVEKIITRNNYNKF